MPIPPSGASWRVNGRYFSSRWTKGSWKSRPSSLFRLKMVLLRLAIRLFLAATPILRLLLVNATYVLRESTAIWMSLERNHCDQLATENQCNLRCISHAIVVQDHFDSSRSCSGDIAALVAQVNPDDRHVAAYGIGTGKLEELFGIRSARYDFLTSLKTQTKFDTGS